MRRRVIRLLLICYHFPPMPTTGARRLARFAKYLPEDFEIDVLTVANPPEQGEPLPLPIELEQRVFAHRAPTLRPLDRDELGARLGTRSRAWRTLQTALTFGLWIPDRQIAWLPAAVRTARALAMRRCPDIVLCSSPPHSSHLVGLDLRQRLPTRLVVDFRDPWSHNPTRRWPTPAHRLAEYCIERRVLSAADLVLANTDGNRRKLIASFPRLDPERVLVIRNGFDPQQRQPLPPRQRKPGEPLRILYAGHLYDGSEALADTLTALDELLPAAATRVVFRLIGSQDPAIGARLRALQASGLVQLAPRQPDAALDAEFQHADALLYVVPNNGDSWIPSKVYDYLAVARPILGLLPQGDAWDLLASSGVATLVDPVDPLAAAAVFRDFLARIAKPQTWSAARAVLDQHDGRKQTLRLADALRQLVDADPKAARRTRIRTAP